MVRHHILLDACVTAAYYAPKTTKSANLKARSKILLDGGSTNFVNHFLIPSFCIAEVFAVFEKYRWGRTWNMQVKMKNTLTKKEFESACDKFRKDIHNGAKILQCELSRYHILAVDLVSPINNAYQIQRKSSRRKVSVAPASTYDMLIVAMSIWLQQHYGKDCFTLVTGDDRVARVIARARSVNLSRTMRIHLKTAAARLGLSYGPELYPEVINLVNVPRLKLKQRFPNWSLSWKSR